MFGTSSNELQSFIQFAAAQLTSDPISPEECLALYRIQNPSLLQREADVVAVREALDAIRAGDKGKPIAEFDRQIRERFNFPCDA